MPDKLVSTLVRFREQNNGILSESARTYEFPELKDDEVEKIESAFHEIFEIGTKISQRKDHYRKKIVFCNPHNAKFEPFIGGFEASGKFSLTECGNMYWLHSFEVIFKN